MKLTLLGCKKLNLDDYKNLIVHTDKEKSTALSLWDRFRDFFRKNKKQDVINTFYELITPSHNENLDSDLKIKFHRFEQLKRMTDPSNRDLFKSISNRRE